MLNPDHVSKVRVLYKSILRLHRGLPVELRALGDQYVKDEFKRHKDCDEKFVPEFLKEWTVRILYLKSISLNSCFYLNWVR